MSEYTINIAEIFGPTICGEGASAGTPSVFVRVGGCDYRCSWCDTMYAVDPAHRTEWQPMTPQAIVQRVYDLSGGVPCLVTLTGGNPALYDFSAVVGSLRLAGYPFAVETQGSIPARWFGELGTGSYITLSPKPPSSGQPFGEHELQRLADCYLAAWKDIPARAARGLGVPHVSLKFVIMDRADFVFAKRLAGRLSGFGINLDVGDVYLSLGNQNPYAGDIDLQDMRRRWQAVVDLIVETEWLTAKLLPQVHTLMWGTRSGV